MKFQVLSLFFFQLGGGFIELKAEFFCFLQCIISLSLSKKSTFLHLPKLLVSFFLHCLKLQQHILQYLKPVIADTDGFFMCIRYLR